MKNKEVIMNYLDELYEDPKCELEYNKDYELLIATVLSAQSTDKRVNVVTKDLFQKYDIFSLKDASVEDIKRIIKSVGTYERKSIYIKEIAKSLVDNYNGIVPNNRGYLESLPGVGRKTTNVVLSNLYNEPAIAVDTHVNRVSKRLDLASDEDDVLVVENKLMNIFPKEKWSRLHHQLVLFGRYNCTSKKPKCNECKIKNICKYYKNNI